METRTRKANYSDQEVFTLLTEFAAEKDLLLSKVQTTPTSKKKKEVWQRITDKVNAIAKCDRTLDELKKKWNDLKAAALSFKASQIKNGGGPTEKCFRHYDLVMDILGQEFAVMNSSDVTECQEQLKRLNDHMQIYLSKLPMTKSGQLIFSSREEANGITWPYYNLLMFIKSQFCKIQECAESNDIKCEIDCAENGLFLEVDEGADTVGDATTPDEISNVSVESEDLSSLDNTGGDASGSSRKRLAGPTEKVYVPEHKKLFQARTSDEWDDFTKDMSNDFRKIHDPFLKLEVKTSVRRAVEQTLLKQLQLDKDHSVNLNASSTSQE